MTLSANAQKWVDALRSGKYTQGRKRLRSYGGHCCLGVACEIAKEEGVIVDYVGSNAFMPTPVAEWLGMRNNSAGCYEGGALYMDNDQHRKSFDQIADIIASEPEGLFDQ